MLKVVFDINVVLSAILYEKSLPALLLSLGLEDKARVFVSPALLNKYEAVFLKDLVSSWAETHYRTNGEN